MVVRVRDPVESMRVVDAARVGCVRQRTSARAAAAMRAIFV